MRASSPVSSSPLLQVASQGDTDRASRLGEVAGEASLLSESPCRLTDLSGGRGKRQGSQRVRRDKPVRWSR